MHSVRDGVNFISIHATIKTHDCWTSISVKSHFSLNHESLINFPIDFVHFYHIFKLIAQSNLINIPQFSRSEINFNLHLSSIHSFYFLESQFRYHSIPEY